MSTHEDSERRVSQLRQIPVFVLKQKLIEFAASETNAVILTNRIEETFDYKPRVIKGAIKKHTGDELVQLLSALPEISDPEVTQLFEEYRYGKNPSFRIYRFGRHSSKAPNDLTLDKCEFNATIKELEDAPDADEPRTKNLYLDDFIDISDNPRIVEGRFRFLLRHDYIDDQENADFIYQTNYGFFWVNWSDRYLIIQASLPVILKRLIAVVEHLSDVKLVSLVITKRLKSLLPFIREEAQVSARVHNPNPGPGQFSYMYIKDDRLHDRGGAKVEQSNSEVRQSSYREEIDEDKQTTLVVSQNGSLRIHGKFAATQFRTWCLARLKEIIDTLKVLEKQMEDYVSTLNIKQTPEFNRLHTKKQKDLLEKIIIGVLTIKKIPDTDFYPLSVSPLQVASELRKNVRVRIQFDCAHPGCDDNGYLVCPFCDGQDFAVVSKDGWNFECPKHRTTKWSATMPFDGKCEQLHRFLYEYGDVEQNIEILLNTKLEKIVSDVICRYFDDVPLNLAKEFFYISGTNLFHSRRRSHLSTPSGQIELRLGDTYSNNKITDSPGSSMGPDSTGSFTES